MFPSFRFGKFSAIISSKTFSISSSLSSPSGIPIIHRLARLLVSHRFLMGFLGGASGKESPCQCGRCKRRGSGPWVGKVGNSCQETCVDRGAWRATVHGVTKSQTRLSAHALESTRLLVLLSFSFKIWLSVCCPEWVISVIPIFQVTYSFSCITYCAICCL